MTTPGPDPVDDTRVVDELLARADSVLPPMSLDPAAVVDRGRRRLRHRTTAVGAGSLLACATALAVVAGTVGPSVPPGNDAVGAPSTASSPTATGALTHAATAPAVLAPGVVAATGRPAADELGQVDLGSWQGVPVWLEGSELHVQAGSDDGVSASRSTDEAQVQLDTPGSPRQGVFVWGTPPHDDPGAVPYLWSTVRPADDPGDGPLVVRVPRFVVPGAADGAPQWAVGMFGSDVDVSDTEQIGVVFRGSNGALSTPACPDLSARTCMDPLPVAVAAAVSAATGEAAAPSSGTGNGHPAPDAQDRAIQRRASLLMQSTVDAVADGDEGAGDPHAAAYWRGLDRRLDTLVADAEAQDFSHGDDGARVVELGFFTYPGFLHERAAEWIGWIEGERVTVSFQDGTGRLRYVGPGPGGERTDVVLPDAGAPMIDVVMHDYDESLVGSVLGFADADGTDHHLDLLTRTWLD